MDQSLVRMNPPLPAQEPTFRDYAKVLGRRRWTIFVTMGLAIALGLAITVTMPPRYLSTARMLVDTRSDSDSRGPLSAIYVAPPSPRVDTQVQVLRSDDLLDRAYAAAGVPRESAKVTVQGVGGTDVIEIAVESRSRKFAERLARAIPQTYFGFMTGSRTEDITRALGFARTRLGQETAQLASAERELQVFRDRAGITDLVRQRESRITGVAWATAAADRALQDAAAVRARLAALETARRSLPAEQVTPLTTTNPRIAMLETQIADLRNQRASLGALYKPADAKVQTLDSQVADLERRLARTPPTVTAVSRTTNPAIASYNDRIADARASLRAASATLARARETAARAQPELARFNRLERIQAGLQRNVDNHRSAVELLARSSQELGLREKATRNPATILSGAGPAEIAAPKPVPYLLVAALIGLVVGIAAAFARDSLDDSIRSPAEARSLLPAPVLGYVPAGNGNARAVPGVGGYPRDIDAFRVVRSSLDTLTPDPSPRALVVTSSMSGEGKSQSAINLATAYAVGGRRTILVDADLRRSAIHGRFHIAQTPGLADILTGEATLDQALHRTAIHGLSVLAAGTSRQDPTEWLSCDAMRRLTDELRSRADVIVFDSPPCLGTADALTLASLTDGIVYIVGIGRATRGAVQNAMGLLGLSRTRLLGVILNRADPTESGADYGYWHSYARPLAIGEGQLAAAAPAYDEREGTLGRGGSGSAAAPVDTTSAAADAGPDGRAREVR